MVDTTKVARPVQLAAERGRATAFATAMRLPQPWARRLAGRPLRLDGLTLSPHTQLMLRLKKLAFEPDVESLPVEEGRAVIRRQSLLVGGEQPIGQTQDLTVPGAADDLRARLYVPRALLGISPGPLLLWLHGGGMVYGDIETYEQVCRFLAEQAGVRVLSVEYRLAPEHPFPAGVDDACAAYEHLARHPEHVDADPRRLAVGGDSAGGYLSAAVAIHAARAGLPLAYQLLIYPGTDWGSDSDSRRLFGRGLYLTREFMDRACAAYLGDHDLRDPRASVAYADLPAGLAPAFVATAGFDPLRDEGEAYARKLAAAGVAVTARRFGAEIHGFANMVGVDGAPRRAMTEMARAVATALRSPVSRRPEQVAPTETVERAATEKRAQRVEPAASP